jgi:hypothetical protein
MVAVAWTEPDPSLGGFDTVRVALRPPGGSWSAARSFPGPVEGLPGSRGPRLAADAQGRLHLIFLAQSFDTTTPGVVRYPWQVYAVRYNTATQTWSSPVALSAIVGSGVGANIDHVLSVHHDGTGVAAWRWFDNAGRSHMELARHHPTDGWLVREPGVPTALGVYAITASAGPQGRVLAAACEACFAPPDGAAPRWWARAFAPTGGWGTIYEFTPALPGNQSLQPWSAADSQGRGWLAFNWRDAASGRYQVWAARFDLQAVVPIQSPVRLHEPDPGADHYVAALEVNPGGRTLLAYQRPTRTFLTRHHDGATGWSSPQLAVTTSPSFVRFALDAQGRALALEQQRDDTAQQIGWARQDAPSVSWPPLQRLARSATAAPTGASWSGLSVAAATATTSTHAAAAWWWWMPDGRLQLHAAVYE